MTEMYDVSARAYLKRARTLLATENPSAMFHAAFELRAGLEARIGEYLEVWDHVSPAAKKAWQIGLLDRHAKDAFSGNSTVADFTFSGPDFRARFLYTPVRAGGRQAAGNLNNYLHAQKKWRDMQDLWWRNFADVLAKAEAELAFAVSGTLLGPVLIKQGRLADMKCEVLEGQPMPLKPEIGAQLNFEVAYHPAKGFEMPSDAYLWRG